jgi:hypothetical protein
MQGIYHRYSDSIERIEVIDGKMGSRAGRPRSLPEAVRKLIIDAAIQQQDTPRDALAEKLELEIANKGFVAPSAGTLKKYISTARSKGIKPLDYPWNIGSCVTYGIPPEATPMLIKYKNKLELIKGKNKSNKSMPSEYFSIRGALWLVNLFPMVKFKFPGDNGDSFDAYLILIVDAYAREEAIHEILKPGQPFDTSGLDDIWFSDDEKSFEDRNTEWNSRYLNMIGGSET